MRPSGRPRGCKQSRQSVCETGRLDGANWTHGSLVALTGHGHKVGTREWKAPCSFETHFASQKNSTQAEAWLQQRHLPPDIIGHTVSVAACTLAQQWRHASRLTLVRRVEFKRQASKPKSSPIWTRHCLNKKATMHQSEDGIASSQDLPPPSMIHDLK